LNEKFVPFAPSYGGSHGKYDWWQTTWKELFANRAEKLHLSTIPGQLWFTISAAGQPVPASKAKDPGRNGDLAGVLKQTLELYKQLPEAQRKPAQPIADANRPTPAPPPGGVVLTVYDRFLQREGSAEYCPLVSGTRGPQRPLHLPGPQRNSLWLTQEECRALMPDNPRRGQTMPVPANLVKRIAFFGLIPGSAWQAEYKWTADSLRNGSLALAVEEASDSHVRIRIHGSILIVTKTVAGYAVDKPNLPEGLNNQYDARLEGTIVYDPTRKQITRWDMAALGDYLGLCYAYDHPKPFATRPLALGFAFELDRGSYELPPELRRNKPMLLTYLPEPFYFDPGKWEADWRKRNQK
jgi:hypothetical protein